MCLLNHRRREAWRLDRWVSSTVQTERDTFLPLQRHLRAGHSWVAAAQPGGALESAGKGRLCLKLWLRLLPHH